MLKKILYSIVAIVIGFVVFYISWKDSCSTAFNHRAVKALNEGNYEFFLKAHKYYEKEAISVDKYDKEVVIDADHNITDTHTTTLRTYNIYANFYVEEDVNGKTKTTTAYRSGIYFLITDLNLDLIPEEKNEPTESSILTKIIITADNGNSYTLDSSTFGYTSTPFISSVFASKEIKEKFIDSTHTDTPTKLTHIKMVTKEAKDSDEVVFFDNDVDISLAEHNEEEYCTNLEKEGKAGVIYTDKEYRDNFVFAFPEMTKSFVITGVTFVILLALGLFIFWPKKSYVPTKEDEDREKYTFATTDEKEQIAIAKVARSKKEKEERENRYRNVRSDKTLDEITEEKLEESMDKENTFEQAIEEDKVAEETSSSEVIEENKEEI